MEDAWHWLIYLVGGGGLSTIIVAWLGWRSKHDTECAEQKVKYTFADHALFERLALQTERVGDLLAKALDRYDVHLMGLRRDKEK